MERLRCKRCGHRWIPRLENPRMCPRCKSARWNDESISKTFVRMKVREEITELLKDGPLFGFQISRKLNYQYPIISLVLMGMDETLVSELEVSRKPTETRKGRATRRYALKEMQMESPLLKLGKCDNCGGYGVTKTIVAGYYWADECLLCDKISNKVFDEKLKENHYKWSKNLEALNERIEKEGIEKVFPKIWEKVREALPKAS